MKIKDLFSWLVVFPLALNFIFMYTNGAKYFNFSDYFIYIILTVAGSGLYILTHKVYHHSILSLLVFLIPIMIVCLSSSLKPYQTDAFSAYLMFFITIFSLSFVKINKEQFNFLTNAYILSAVVMSLILVIQRRLPYEIYGIVRYGLYYDELNFYDINFTATYLLVPGLLSFFEWLKGKKFYLVTTIVIFIALLMTVSRGAVVPFIGIVFYKLWKDHHFKLWHWLLFVVVLAIGTPFIPEHIYNRLFAESYTADGSNQKRALDWLVGIRVFLDSPIIGNGMIDTNLLTTQVVAYTTAHNSFLVWLINFGIVGFMTVLNLLIWIYYRLKIMSEYHLIYLALLFSVFMIEANLSMVLLAPLTYFVVFINKDIRGYNVKNNR